MKEKSETEIAAGLMKRCLTREFFLGLFFGALFAYGLEDAIKGAIKGTGGEKPSAAAVKIAPREEFEPGQPLGNLYEAMEKRDQLRAWAALAVTDIMSFGYDEVDTHLPRIRDAYFTPESYKDFRQALDQARLVDMLTANQQDMTAAPRGAGVIEPAALEDGGEGWIYRGPFIVTYAQGTLKRSDSLMMTIRLLPVLKPDGRTGIVIGGWQAVPG